MAQDKPTPEELYNEYPFSEFRKHKIEEYTCYKCKDYANCTWVFDEYNTNGDCIAWK